MNYKRLTDIIYTLSFIRNGYYLQPSLNYYFKFEINNTGYLSFRYVMVEHEFDRVALKIWIVLKSNLARPKFRIFQWKVALVRRKMSTLKTFELLIIGRFQAFLIVRIQAWKRRIFQRQSLDRPTQNPLIVKMISSYEMSYD